jgi:hypothetical protein
VAGLTPGDEYQFIVESRNSYGYSLASEKVTIAAGFVPFAPTGVTSTRTGSNVMIEWIAPASNGAPLIGYRVEI